MSLGSRVGRLTDAPEVFFRSPLRRPALPDAEADPVLRYFETLTSVTELLAIPHRGLHADLGHARLVSANRQLPRRR